MYTYRVKFDWNGCCFTETITVYNVNSRKDAIKVVKEHYGSVTKIYSAKRVNDTGYF